MAQVSKGELILGVATAQISDFAVLLCSSYVCMRLMAHLCCVGIAPESRTYHTTAGAAANLSAIGAGFCCWF
jgi:hypothetical protein